MSPASPRCHRFFYVPTFGPSAVHRLTPDEVRRNWPAALKKE